MKLFDHISELVILQREQNGLLRELLMTLGRKPLTPHSGGQQPKMRQYTAADVTQVTKTMRAEMDREAQTRDTGPASETTSR